MSEVTQVTTENIGTPIPEIQMHLDPSLVKVKVSYPAKYEGKKHLEDGKVYWVSREAADTFIEKGIATEEARTKDENPGETIEEVVPAISTAPEVKTKKNVTETKK